MILNFVILVEIEINHLSKGTIIVGLIMLFNLFAGLL